MARSVRTVGLLAFTAAATAILIALVLPGCMQNQDNSPISISNSQGRALSVACSTDGSVAYVTDGRDIYRYDRRTSGPGPLLGVHPLARRAPGTGRKARPARAAVCPHPQDKPAEQKQESKPTGKN